MAKTNQFPVLLTVIAAAVLLPKPSRGHEVVTTRLTWSKEVSRVVYRSCAGCHREGGKAFSLLSYAEARPWAKAIQEAVLRRQMPPWNAVKGFGELKHDIGLSQEEIHVLSDWVEGGAPEGDPSYLPKLPVPQVPYRPLPPGISMPFRGAQRMGANYEILAVNMGSLAAHRSFKLVAETPWGEIIPVLWIEDYSASAEQTYELREPLPLPTGSKLIAYPPVDGLRIVARRPKSRP